MMSTTGLLCLVAALVSTVSCQINCAKCLNINGTECDSEETVVCPNGCATFSEYSVVQKRLVPSIKRDCAPQGLTQSITLALNDDGQLLEQLNVAVCEENHCNKETKFRYDPNALGRPNGLFCESCSRENCKAKECKSCDRVPCRGDQHQCLSLSGTFKRGDGTILHFVSKGCISDLGCIVKYEYLVGTKVQVERSFECTNATQNERDCSGCGGNSYY